MDHVIFLFLMSCSSVVFGGGTLQIGDVTVEQDQVVIPVLLGGNLSAGNTGVASMNFRISYNADTLTPVSASPGAAAAGAQKQVMASAKDGEYTVVVMGMNQTVCSPGEVARIVMKRTGADRTWGLNIGDACLSTPDGKVLECRTIPYDGKEADENPSGREPAGENDKKPSIPAIKPDKPAPEEGGAEHVQPPQQPSTTHGISAGGAPGAPVIVESQPRQLAAALQDIRQTRQDIVTPGTRTESETEAVDGESEASISGDVPAAGATPSETVEKPDANMLALVQQDKATFVQSSPQSALGVPDKPKVLEKGAGASGIAKVMALTALPVVVLGALFLWRRRLVK